MNVLSLCAFSTFLLTLGCGILALVNDHKNRLNQAFAIYAGCWALWSFGNVFVYPIQDLSTTRLFLSISMLGWFLLIPHGLLVQLLFAGWNFRKAVLFYLPFLGIAIFSIVATNTGFFYQFDFQATVYGYDAYVVDAPVAYLDIILYPITLIGNSVVFLAARKSKSRRYKKIAYSLIVLELGLVIVGSVLDLLPDLVGTPFPGVACMVGAPAALVVYFLVYKMQYLRFKLPSVEVQLLENVAEPVTICDQNLMIVKINQSARKLFDRTEKELTKSKISSFVTEKALLESEWDKAASKGLKQLRLSCSIRGQTFNLSIGLIYDEYRDLVGGLIIFGQDDLFARLIHKYGISTREREVLFLLVKGVKTAEIADTLYIALGTAKNHVHNIYLKTGAVNRVELVNLLLEPNLRRYSE